MGITGQLPYLKVQGNGENTSSYPKLDISKMHFNYVVDRHNTTALARDKQYCGNGDFFKLLGMNREMVKTGFIY